MKLLIFFLFTIQIVSAQQSCEEGFNTDPNTGRCVEVKINVNGTSETSGEIQDDLLKKLEENNNPEEIKKAANQIAEDATKDNQTKNSELAQGAISSATAAIPTMLSIGLAQGMIANTCTAPSGIAMIGAGGVVFGGEVLNVLKFKKRKKKLEKDMKKLIAEYKTIENPTLDQKKAFSSKLQAEAFEIMAMAEDAVAKAAGTKQTAHQIAATIYYAAAATATLEAMGVFSNAMTCTGTSTDPGLGKMVFSAFNLAGAGVQSLLNLVTKGKSLTKKGASTTVGRAVVATIAGTLSATIAKKAQKQKEGAQQRAANIREMKMAFVYGDDWSECEADDRTKPDKPQCYCFNEDWSKNPARSESQVCNQHWGKTYAPEETDYSNYLAANGDSQSCVTKDYKDDPRCNCRSTNSCLSLPISNLNLQSFPGISTVSRSNAEIANRYFQGKLEEGDLAKLENGNSAFANKQLLDKMSQNPETKKIADNIKENTAKFEEAMGKQMVAASNSSAGSAKDPLSSPFENKVNKELKKTTLKQEAVIVKSNQRSLNKNSISAPNLDLDFSSMGSTSSKSGSVEVLNETAASQTNYDSFESPVNADNGQSIFKVITHRYHQTGIKKLFAKRKRIKAE